MSSVKTTDSISPGVLSLLPLFYVGWSDSVLSPSEMKLIHQMVGKLSFLSAEEKKQLISWSNPQQPPDSETFRFWRREIIHNSRNFSSNQKKSLISLGLEMARTQSNSSEKAIWLKEDTLGAIQKLEKALGVSSNYSADVLLSQIHQELNYASEKSNFDVEKLVDILDGPYSETLKRVKNILCDPEFELIHEPDKDLYRLLTLKRLKLLADQGLSSYSFPVKYGGKDLRGHHIAVFEALSYGDLSLTVKFGVQFGLFGGALFLLGNESQHKQYLEKMHRGELLGCFAMTETNHGSNVKDLETIATYLPETDELEIHSVSHGAGKEYIGNAFHAQLAVVFAQLSVNATEHGVHAILVPIRDNHAKLIPGVRIKDCGYKIGLNGVDNGRIWFDKVRVPRENLLDKYGGLDNSGLYSSEIESQSKRFFTMIGTLVLGRISIGLASVSVSKKSLSIAIKYALKRRQFGAKEDGHESLIMDYTSHQERLIPRLSEVYAYHFALRTLAEEQVKNTNNDTRKIETMAAGLKAKASWQAVDIIQVCREACGGKGYLVENQLSALKADADIFTTFEGDNTVLMQLVAKGILTDFKQSFHDEGSRAIIAFLLKKAAFKIDEYNPVQRRNTESVHLRSSEFLLEAFEYRYQKTLIRLSERMRKYLKRRIDPFQAFLRTQLHMIDLADAYIDLLVLQSFSDSKGEVNDSGCKSILEKLFQLYGLSTIYRNRGWYLENDYMEGSKSKAIRRVINKLYQEIRPELKYLVDAFDIPDELLAAPIARKSIP